MKKVASGVIFEGYGELQRHKKLGMVWHDERLSH